MMRRIGRWIVYPLLLVAFVWIIYFRSNLRKLNATDRIYAELEHPAWSERLLRDKAIHPNLGSGDHNMLYLIDVRRVSIPIAEAVAHYDRETDRLGFRECHVDRYPQAKEKFDWEWQRMGLDIPEGDDILIVSQRFTSNSTIRRTQPAESGRSGF